MNLTSKPDGIRGAHESPGIRGAHESPDIRGAHESPGKEQYSKFLEASTGPLSARVETRLPPCELARIRQTFLIGNIPCMVKHQSSESIFDMAPNVIES